ncbi:hypothetical protein K461DRAFT_297891 [Myriangium duriaei CBS 260.36]|uniref:Uncharacterized protein n=1 Tax=Myriangium duriaei CBS 260.36 TaxID=1168546 RepID=A0A9P4IR12_9PEZI|nr:hypothetical protein K461DRAFT_297891 [Myriangium duriaei CBS 260.36]
METSQVFDSTQHASPSPCGRYIASLTPQNLHIQSALSLSPTHLFPLPANLKLPPDTSLQWSPTSSHILLLSSQSVHVFSLANPDSKTHVNNGSGGLGKIIAAELLADGTQLMVVWEFGRVGMWDLASGRATEVGDLKMGGRGNPWAFRRDAGRAEVLVLLMRQNAQDVLNFYLPPNNVAFRSVTLPTADALAISWSTDGQWVGVFDSFLGPQQCHIYTADGFPFRQFPASGQETSSATESSALGYKSMVWSRQHVALAEAQSMTFLNTRTFTQAFSIALSSIKTETTSLEDSVDAFQESINAAKQRSYATLTGQLIPVPTTKSSIIDVQFNTSGTFLSCRDASSPGTLYLCNTAKRKVHSILLQHASIRKATWHPIRETLIIILSEDGSLYLWDIESGQAPMHISHSFENRPEIARVDSKWVAKSGPPTDISNPEDDKLAIVVTTKKAGFQLVWPEGQPDPSADQLRSSVHAGAGEVGDASEDSLYDILSGRTPLPELKVRQVEAEVAAEETERLDDTFREKREQVMAQTQAQAATGGKPTGDIDDDSEIF